MGKFFVLNADDFGLSKEHNKAVLEGYNNGFLTSVSLLANGDAFSAAVNDILPECPNLSVGVHLNITSGKSLTNCDLLTNQNGFFNGGFLYFFINSTRKEFVKQLEKEFRAQIEKVKQYSSIDHIDSHDHIHSIPEIFKLVARLAKEYQIPYVRTHYEEIYFVPEFCKHLNFKFPFNLIKVLFLNLVSKENKKTIQEQGLKTNDYASGLEYAGMLDAEVAEFGLKAITDDNCVVEAIINPYYSNLIKNSQTTEFTLTQDRKLEDTVNRQGFEITNYKKII